MKYYNEQPAIICIYCSLILTMTLIFGDIITSIIGEVGVFIIFIIIYIIVTYNLKN